VGIIIWWYLSNFIFEIPPSPSTIECDVLPRPGSWDLGPPRMVDIRARALPLFGSAMYGIQVNVHYTIVLWWQFYEKSNVVHRRSRMPWYCFALLSTALRTRKKEKKKKSSTWPQHAQVPWTHKPKCKIIIYMRLHLEADQKRVSYARRRAAVFKRARWQRWGIHSLNHRSREKWRVGTLVLNWQENAEDSSFHSST